MKPSAFLGKDAHTELSAMLQKKHHLIISGASNETARALLISHVYDQHSRPMIVVTPDAAARDTLHHWLSFFEVPVSIATFPTDDDPGIEDLASITAMLSGNGIYVITEDVWNAELPYLPQMQNVSLTFTKGQHVDFTETFNQLIDQGYDHGEDRHCTQGEYRRIGDTVEIVPLGSEHQYRITFAFDEIESIQKLDSEDPSKVIETIDELTVLPISWDRTALLKDQFPEDAALVVDGVEDVVLDPENGDTLEFTPFPKHEENHVHLRYLSVLKFYTLTDFLNDLRDKLQQGWSLSIVTKRADELRGILDEESIRMAKGDHATPGSVLIVPSGKDDVLPHSIQNPDTKCALLTDREIFTLRKDAQQRSVQRLSLEFVTSLHPGDYVVHMEHGIGRFQGMTQKMVDNTEREYLEMWYAAEDKLFVPVDQADKLSKYVYEEGNEPQLTRLGSHEWQKVTKKVSEETEKIAKELLEIYAKRAKAKGHTYDEDNEKQKKFEASFPYTETPGQMRAVEDIKKDMEGPHPMDRLVCGDVGFGKTEVAMRAAFKAVQSGKQVAFLAPITILADQHYQSMEKRMKEFGVRIAALSRFKSAKEQKVILEKLRKGDIDIVVGTHRLLGADVKFFNLGMVIIDEEQRFGVKQKEKLKSMRADVDMLTLTATPIPRTLNLGLHKLRDITTITTPPPGRLPIITEVRKYSDALIRQAVRAELERKGQVYVLHNRVETIDAFAHKLKALIPQANFIVAHGQLKPEVLEERIRAFKNGEAQVLVSSTIIENGIDLPRANTLIVNEAEHFGLSQLYQLRGRVGRGKTQAYAYFLYHSQRLKDDAKKRLQAIVEASELGSGFQISMRDLEIRGAGEILGASQSGNMQTVGVSHYLRMLKQAVESLKAGGKAEAMEEISPEILLPVEAFIPSFYITDPEEKINIYQKLAGSEEEGILKEFAADLKEEYGALPQQVHNLFAVLRLKMICKRAGVTRIKMEDGKDKEVVVSLAARVTAKEIMQLLQKNPQWRISGATLRIDLEKIMHGTKGDAWVDKLTEELSALIVKKK